MPLFDTQASKNLFEGLTAKLTSHLAPQDTHLQKHVPGDHMLPSKAPDGKTKGVDGALAVAALALGKLVLPGKVTVQPGG